MKAHQRRSTESAERSGAFTTANAAVLGPLDTTPAGKQLADALAQVSALSAEQAVAERSLAGHGAVQKQLARGLREEHMLPIAKFARAHLRGAPGYAALSKSGGGLRGKALVTAAVGMATAGQAYQQELVASQFPPDTLDQLTAAAAALANTIADRTNAKQTRVRTTAGIKEQVRRAREAVAMLDPIVTKKLAGNPALLAEWRSAKRVTGASSVTAVPAV